MWFSRTQKCVTLSTTEVEYVAMSDGEKEALYVRGVLVFLKPSLGSPSIGVFEDNKGAIDLAKTSLSSSNSKHIGIRRVGGEGGLVGQVSPDGRPACGHSHEDYWQGEIRQALRFSVGDLIVCCCCRLAFVLSRLVS